MTSTFWHILNKETHRKRELYSFEYINTSKKFDYKKYNQKRHHVQHYDGRQVKLQLKGYIRQGCHQNLKLHIVSKFPQCDENKISTCKTSSYGI